MSAPPIYVETTIRTSMAALWERTQDPVLHQQWDLRFTDIQYLPRVNEQEPQRFLYETRIGFGLRIAGQGESAGEHDQSSGTRTSALKFWSDDPKSLIRTGAGYWQYVPVDGGVRFLTRYDYETRFGAAGRLVDRLLFRPSIGWATAWSFDRLRLWLEEGIEPAVSMERSLVYSVARAAVGAIWLYQGLVPKLLVPDSGELEILRGSGAFPGRERLVLTAAGCAETALGAATLLRWHDRWPLWTTALLMPFLLASAARGQPSTLVAPFNPVVLNLAMAALSAVATVLGRRLPDAGRCLRQPRRSRGRPA